MTITADLMAFLIDQRAGLPNVAQALDLIERAEQRAAALPPRPSGAQPEQDGWVALLADEPFDVLAAMRTADDAERADALAQRAHQTAQRIVARARRAFDAAIQADNVTLLLLAAKARRDGTATRVHEHVAVTVPWPPLAHRVAHQSIPGDATLGGTRPSTYESWWPLRWDLRNASRQDFVAWQQWAWREFADERFTITDTDALHFTERWTPPAIESGALDTKQRRGQPLLVAW